MTTPLKMRHVLLENVHPSSADHPRFPLHPQPAGGFFMPAFCERTTMSLNVREKARVEQNIPLVSVVCIVIVERRTHSTTLCSER